MKKAVVGNCEICGNNADITSRLNKDSYLIATVEGKLINYDTHFYCEKHFLEILNKLWKRVKHIW